VLGETEVTGLALEILRPVPAKWTGKFEVNFGSWGYMSSCNEILRMARRELRRLRSITEMPFSLV